MNNRLPVCFVSKYFLVGIRQKMLEHQAGEGSEIVSCPGISNGYMAPWFNDSFNVLFFPKKKISSDRKSLNTSVKEYFDHDLDEQAHAAASGRKRSSASGAPAGQLTIRQSFTSGNSTLLSSAITDWVRNRR